MHFVHKAIAIIWYGHHFLKHQLGWSILWSGGLVSCVKWYELSCAFFVLLGVGLAIYLWLFLLGVGLVVAISACLCNLCTYELPCAPISWLLVFGYYFIFPTFPTFLRFSGFSPFLSHFPYQLLVIFPFRNSVLIYTSGFLVIFWFFCFLGVCGC